MIGRQLNQVELSNTTATSVFQLGILTALDVDTIDWQRTVSSGGSEIRYTFNSTPDLSSVKVGHYAEITSSTNSSNDGVLRIIGVDDSTDYIDVYNPGRGDDTDDEASDSPSVVAIKPSPWVHIKKMRIMNTSGAGIVTKVYHDADGSTYSTATQIAQQTVNGNDYWELTDFSVEDATGNIAVESASATGDLTVTLYGAYMGTPLINP